MSRCWVMPSQKTRWITFDWDISTVWRTLLILDHLQQLAVVLLCDDELVDVLLSLGLMYFKGCCHPWTYTTITKPFQWQGTFKRRFHKLQQKWEKMRQKVTFRHRCWPGLRLLLLYPAQTRWSDLKKDENTIICPQLPVREQHLRKGSVSRCRTLRGKPSGNSSPGGTYRIMQKFLMMKTILKARRLLLI